MGRKGASTGLKRKPAPKFWPIHRKEAAWVVKPSPGPHSLGSCIPLAIALRDITGFAKTRKEAKTIVSKEKVYVNGRIIRNDDFPIGLMDVVSLPEIDKHFRMLPSRKGLLLSPVDKEEAKFKLCRIENKRIGMGGHVQMNFHDGSNMLIRVADPKSPAEDIYETLDTLRISIPERQVIERIELKEKSFGVITGGENVGRFGRIAEIEKAAGKKRRNALVTVEDEKGGRYQTVLDFLFAVGEKAPVIALPEATQIV